MLLAVIFLAGTLAMVALYKLRKRVGGSTERGGTFPVFSKTFSFSIGPPPVDIPSARILPEAEKLAPLDPHVRDKYVRYWERAKERFERNPLESVKEAQEILMDLSKERGSSAVSLTERQEYTMDLIGALSGADDLFARVVNAQSAARGIAAAREGSEANVEDLRNALLVYESAFQRLIGES